MDVRSKTKVKSVKRATRPPQQGIRAGSSDSSTKDFIRKLIEDKEFDNERDLFSGLELASDEQHAYGVYVKKYKQDDLDTDDKRIKYQRETTVYNRKMYNKFFVPIWAAAMVDNTAYIMYPLLTPLTEILPTHKIDEMPAKVKEMKLMEVLRRCFAPIALGLDALHTPVPNSRTMYYHRDLSMKRIYMSESDNGKSVLYGDAMLKLSKLTRGSQEETLDVSHSINNYSFPRQYFHHPDPWKPLDDNVYHRRHDWFSFGVYIVDVLVNVLPISEDISDKLVVDGSTRHIPRYEDVSEYVQFAVEVEACIEHIAWNLRSSKPMLEQYLAVAKTCMSMTTETGEEITEIEQVMHYEFPSALRERFSELSEKNFDSYHFEYALSRWTAELLWTYDDSRTDEAKKFVLSRPKSREALKTSHKKGAEYVCQACLLHQSVGIPTRTYRRAKSRQEEQAESHTTKYKCDENCNTFYCASCYTNGERLFCPRQHGTTSSVIGHYSSFAIIMYGYERNGVFKKDATSLANVLTHKLICGIPEENVVVRPLFHEGQLSREPKDLLRDACYEIRRRIHKRKPVGAYYEDVDTCVNDSSYTLFIFYSGHGERGGHWCISTFEDRQGQEQNMVLKKNIIDQHLMSLRECTNVDNPTCEADCVDLTYLMDHCYNIKKKPPVVDDIDGTSTVLVTPMINEQSHYDPNYNSEITRWFCELLRCTCFHDVENKKQECDVCAEFKYHTAVNCYDAFIDGHGLEIFKKHLCAPDFKSAVPRVAVELVDNSKGKTVVIAHYHKDGIHLKVFPYKEGMEPVDIEFCVDLTCDTIKEMIVAKLKEQDPKKYKKRDLHICLLANVPNDYSRFSLVCDSKIRKVLDSSLLYYHLLMERSKVVLTAVDGGRILEDPLENVDISPCDLPRLVLECGKVERSARSSAILSTPCLLPNLLVHIVHHLRHTVYRGGIADPADSMYSRQASALSQHEVKLYQPTTSQDDSDLTETDRVRNSFVGLLYRRPRSRQRVKEYTVSQWNELEEETMQYIRAKRTRVFDVDFVEGKANEVCVKWDMSSLPAPGVYGERDYPQSIVEGTDELDEEFDDEHVNYSIEHNNASVDSTTCVFSSASVDSTPVRVNNPVGDSNPVAVSTPVGVSTPVDVSSPDTAVGLSSSDTVVAVNTPADEDVDTEDEEQLPVSVNTLE